MSVLDYCHSAVYVVLFPSLSQHRFSELFRSSSFTVVACRLCDISSNCSCFAGLLVLSPPSWTTICDRRDTFLRRSLQPRKPLRPCLIPSLLSLVRLLISLPCVCWHVVREFADEERGLFRCGDVLQRKAAIAPTRAADSWRAVFVWSYRFVEGAARMLRLRGCLSVGWFQCLCACVSVSL